MLHRVDDEHVQKLTSPHELEAELLFHRGDQRRASRLLRIRSRRSPHEGVGHVLEIDIERARQPGSIDDGRAEQSLDAMQRELSV